MSLTVTTDVFCDGKQPNGSHCDKWHYGCVSLWVNGREARDNARREGWYCGPKGDYCPAHAKQLNLVKTPQSD